MTAIMALQMIAVFAMVWNYNRLMPCGLRVFYDDGEQMFGGDIVRVDNSRLRGNNEGVQSCIFARFIVAGLREYSQRISDGTVADGGCDLWLQRQCELGRQAIITQAQWLFGLLLSSPHSSSGFR